MPKTGKLMNTNFKSNLALVVFIQPAKFQIDQSFKASSSLENKIFWINASLKWANGPISIFKATKPWCCPVTLLSFKLIEQNV